MQLRRVPTAISLLLAATLVAGQGAFAQSPSAAPDASTGTAAACPALTAGAAPLRDPAATETLPFAAPNPDTAVGGFHPGADWSIPDGTTAGAPVSAIGDGEIMAVQPAASGGRGGLVVVRHAGPFEIAASPDGAPFVVTASTEDSVLAVYGGIDPAADLAPGTCTTADTQLGTVTPQCADGVAEPCSTLPAALHLEIRLASTIDPAAPPADWWLVGAEGDSTNGWFADVQTMVDDGLRDPAAFLAALPATGEPGASPAPSAEPTTEPAGTPDPTAAVSKLLGKDGRLTVLLLGSDKFNSSCNNRGDLGGERTDTIMFATINPQTGRVALASLPRDTIQVPIGAGATYGPKITGLFSDYLARTGKRTKALRSMVRAMEAFSGVEIDYYALTYFCGVRRVVDAVGGINVRLSSALVDPSMHLSKKGLVLKKGKHKLNGKQALAFARTRHSDSDYQRARRQQQVIVGVAERLRKQGIKALPFLVELARGKVAKGITRFQTDFPLDQVPALWGLLQKAKLSDFKSTVLSPPTYATEGQGANLYSNFPNMAAIRSYFNQAFKPVKD